MSDTDSLQSLAAGQTALLSGDPLSAVAVLEALVSTEPANVEARYWLASAKLTAGAPQAASALDDARTLHAILAARAMGIDTVRCQTDAVYAGGIADHLYGQKLVAMSSVIRRFPVMTGAIEGNGLLSYGLALQHQGRIDEACEVFRATAQKFPTAPVHQFLIYPQLFCEDGAARHCAAAREWAAVYARGAPAAPHANPDRRGRKLNIGYVAPWFASSQLKQFIAPLLEQHDPETVSVTLYPTDAGTEADWPAWVRVHPLGQLADAEAAKLIRGDGIDVLADCWGHSASSRLSVFSYRPAPVQIAWMNYIQTTGLKQIDYVLHADAAEIFGGRAEDYTEQIWRIGPVFNAFRAAAGRLPPVPTPALKTGQVTFGSFNHPAKLSGPALDAWATVLRGASASRLILKYSYFVDPILQRVTQARFAARGVAPERIVFAGHSSGDQYFQAFREIDLMLDAWPAHGSTTTLEALSNGVPMLVKSSPGAAGHYVRSILEACGLRELIASSAEDFVTRAVDLASDVPRLDDLRSRVRPGFDGGACADEVGFTRRVEAAFGEMFDVWFASARGARAYG